VNDNKNKFGRERTETDITLLAVLAAIIGPGQIGTVKDLLGLIEAEPVFLSVGFGGAGSQSNSIIYVSTKCTYSIAVIGFASPRAPGGFGEMKSPLGVRGGAESS